MILPNATSFQNQTDGIGTSNKKLVSIDPNPGESFADYYNRVGREQYDGRWMNANPDSFIGRLNDWFTGEVSSARDRYNTWYNEQSALKKAQADYEYTRLLNQTQYSDLIKSIQDAGLNPYMILNNGGVSSGNMSYSSSEAPMRSTADKKKSNIEGKAIGAIALIVAGILKAVL